MKKKIKHHIGKISRREALAIGGKALGLGAALSASGLILGCGQNFTSTNNNTGDGGTETTSGNWAAGGTNLISVDYPSDSIFTSANTCAVALTGSTTLGPCYFADSTGEDISVGREGLPMQLCLQLVDRNCNPLSGYKIEVWHCDNEGVYSGDTSSSSDASSFAGSFCTGGSSAAASSTWFRGMLTTNSSGRVNFKSCFPGWYRGRTIHIHFAVVDSSNNRQLISQLCFDDSLAAEICNNHSYYSARGTQDTPLSGGRDTVFPSSGYDEYMLTTAENDDGSLLAFHTIMLT